MIKEMHIRGAERGVLDASGKSIIDVIHPGIPEEAKETALRVLGPQPLFIPCSMLKTPLMKVDRSYSPMAVYVFLVLSSYVFM